MARRQGRDSETAAAAARRRKGLNAPFRALRQQLAAQPAPPAKPILTRPATPPEAGRAAGEEDLFARAMDGVVPLPREPHRRIDAPPPASAAGPPLTDDAEVLAALSDLVRGEARFDLSDTREYVEGNVVGLDPRLVRKLRRGEFAHKAHIDLHGLTAEEARVAVERFLVDAYRLGHRCVLIVHGRGRNSKDQIPVLKERLKTWLARGRIARVVLAFATARPCDGGAGALYVLLRRDRSARPIQVTEGAAS